MSLPYFFILKEGTEGFSWRTVDKNPPASTGDMGRIPGPGKFHTPRSNQARLPQLLSLHAATPEAHEP